MYVGIDVGANRLHCVALDTDSRVIDARLFSPADLEDLVSWLNPAESIAIDSPDALSTARHSENQALSPKFRRARCAEIGLGQQRKVWVPWATPWEPPVAGWMQLGFNVFSRLRSTHASVVEIYPHAGFLKLHGWKKLPSKSTVEGLVARATLLAEAGVDEARLNMWSHDSLDAALGALVALRFAQGRAESFTCGHDGSAIWLP